MSTPTDGAVAASPTSPDRGTVATQAASVVSSPGPTSTVSTGASVTLVQQHAVMRARLESLKESFSSGHLRRDVGSFVGRYLAAARKKGSISSFRVDEGSGEPWQENFLVEAGLKRRDVVCTLFFNFTLGAHPPSCY